jgi:hypothetical protein
MAVDQDSAAKVSGILLGHNAWTNVACSVHQAPQMMPQSHAVAGVYGLYPMRSISMPKNSVKNNVKMLRADVGCTPGLNISNLSTVLRFHCKIPCINLWVVLLVCFVFVLQPVVASQAHAPTLSIYALNANGFVSPAKIHHVNNVIRSRCLRGDGCPMH